MVILYQGERADIVAKEEDIKAGTKKVYAMFKIGCTTLGRGKTSQTPTTSCTGTSETNWKFI